MPPKTKEKEKVSERKENPAIELKNLTKRFGETIAVDSVNFNIQEGEFFGLLGPNGAGKTTLTKMLVGLASPSDGTAFVFGKDVREHFAEVNARIGLAPTEGNFDREFEVWDNLVFHAGYFGVPRGEREKRVEEFLRMFDLWDKRDSKTYSLSSGMRKKLLFARAMIADPDILILDEPTAGLDVDGKQQIHDYMQKINREGLTIILTTHQMSEAEKHCERVAIMNEGNIVALGAPDKLLEKSRRDIVKISLENKIDKIPDLFEGEKYQAEITDNNRELQISVPEGEKAAADILPKLVQEGIKLESVSIETSTLEDVFKRVT